MMTQGMITRLIGAVLLATLTITSASAGDAAKPQVTLVFDHVLPNVPGKSIKGVLVEYPPGSSSPAHTHPHSAFIYATILEGAIRSKVNGGPEKIYHTGESFAELPGDHHGVSANASATEPAKLLAIFVLDTDDTTLVFDDPQQGALR